MCEVSFDNYAELWQQTPRKARKEHKCSSCGAKVQPGEAYMSHFSLQDGYAVSEKVCFRCWWVQEDFGTQHGFTPTPSALTEFLRECVLDGERNKHSEQHWRDALAGIMARYRVSDTNRKYQRKRWAERKH